MPNDPPIPHTLKARISEIANRYQCALLMRCWIRFGCITLAVVVGGLAVLKLLEGIEYSRLWPISIFVLAEFIALLIYVIRPMRRPVTRGQIALYIEEKYPDLENRLVTAVELESGHIEGTSPWMIERFFEDTGGIVKRISFQELLDPDLLTRLLVISVCILFLSGLIATLFHSLWLPDLLGGQSPRPMLSPESEFTVEPGNARIRIGDNLAILCKMRDGKTGASLQWRFDGEPWQKESMEASVSPGLFLYSFNQIQRNIEYAVEVGSSRSELFTIQTWIPPALKSMDAVYHFPPYLNREPLESPNVASLFAVEGTRVDLTVWVNKKIQSAELVFDSSATLALAESSELGWNVSFTPETNGRFSIVLTDEDGEESEFNPQYDMIVQADKPPEAALIFPRQDMESTSLEEIPIEFRVTDDFAIEEYGIAYEIAGRERTVVPLQGTQSVGAEANVSYVFRLEELGLEAGDLITWAVWARDFKPDRGEFETLGDPFFIEIRPFKRWFENAVSNAGASQEPSSGQSGENREASSQKDILIATWNLRREASRLEPEAFNEKRDAITRAQQNLLEDTLNPDGGFQGDPQRMTQLIDAIQSAVKKLKSAQWPDPAEALAEAMTYEQKAYRLILQMRPDRTQVQQLSRRGGNEGGERSDIGELELERKRNFYEEERRIQQQMEKTEEALNQINDLTRRQKSINEEISRLISELKKESAPEEFKRQLERLQEEERRNLERLDEMESALAASGRRDSPISEALRRLNDVRQQMNRGLEQMESERLQEARVSGSRAVSALDRMQEEIQQLSHEGASQRLSELREEMNDLIARERSILDRIESLKKEQETPSLDLDPKLNEKKSALLEEKSRLADDFRKTLSTANEIAERSRLSQRLLSQKLGDWMRETSGRGIYEDILNEWQMPLIQYGIWDRAIQRERQLLDKLTQSAEKFQEAEETLIASDLDGMRRALDTLENLVESQSAIADSVSAASPGRAIGDAADSLDRNGVASGGTIRKPSREGILSPEAMPRFVESDSREWMEALRNAERLLPGETPSRERLIRIREAIEGMRGQFGRNRQPPAYDLFLDSVVDPLLQAMAELEKTIQTLLSQDEFVWMDEGDIPDAYREQVADYFKNLSEIEKPKE